MDTVQRGDSFWPGLGSTLADLANAPTSHAVFACAKTGLWRLQLLAVLKGWLPSQAELSATELETLVQWWGSECGPPQQASSVLCASATRRWLAHRSPSQRRLATVVRRLLGDTTPLSLTQDSLPQFVDASSGFADAVASPTPEQTLAWQTVLVKWLQRLLNRPCWTHLPSVALGQAPQAIANVFRRPSLERIPYHAGRRQRLDSHSAKPGGRQQVGYRLQDIRDLVDGCESITWITGEPGAGKTSLLLWLVHEQLRNEAWPEMVPIMIDLKRYSDYCQRNGFVSLVDYFLRSLEVDSELSVAVQGACAQGLPRSPRCLVLLDGWTCCDLKWRERVWAEVQGLSAWHKLIVTSRRDQCSQVHAAAWEISHYELSGGATTTEVERLQALQLTATGLNVRALHEWSQTSDVQSLDAQRKRLNFVGDLIHHLWQRENVLTNRQYQLTPGHWHVLEQLALASCEVPTAAPEWREVELARLCVQQNIPVQPLYDSRLMVRSDRDATSWQFAQPAYRLYFAAASLVHQYPRPDVNLLRNWLLRDSGAEVIAYACVMDHQWKRRAAQCIKQGLDTPDLLGHQWLRLAEVAQVATADSSQRRYQLIDQLKMLLKPDCPPEIASEVTRAIDQLQNKSYVSKAEPLAPSLPSIAAQLTKLAYTPTSSAEMDALLRELAGYAWPSGHELLMAIFSDSELPADRRELARQAMLSQPAELMSGPLVHWLDSLWAEGPEASNDESANKRWARLLVFTDDCGWQSLLQLLSQGQSEQAVAPPWLEWLVHHCPSIAVRLTAMRLWCVAHSHLRSTESYAQLDQCLKTVEAAIDDTACDETLWANWCQHLPRLLAHRLQSSAIRRRMIERLSLLVGIGEASKLPAINRLSCLLTATYLPTDRITGKQLIRDCLKPAQAAHSRHRLSPWIKIIVQWLATISKDEPEVLFEFDREHPAYRLAMQSVVWRHRWLMYADRIVDRNGNVIADRVLDNQFLLDDESSLMMQRIAQSLPDRQRAAFLSYCHMVTTGDSQYRYQAPDLIYRDMLAVLKAEAEGRMGEQLSQFYDPHEPLPKFESWRKNLQRVQQRFQDDPEILAHLRQLGLGATIRKPR